MLTTEQARRIAEHWRPQFSDAENYLTSVQRYLDRVPAARRDQDGLERWLAADADQEQVRSLLLTPKPVAGAGENLPQQLPDLVDDCETCHGKRLLRRELPVGHPDFGHAMLCPSCSGRPTQQLVAPAEPERYRCAQCHAFQDEWAADACGNPKWHDPNWTSGTYPKERPVPGWHTIADVA